MVTDVEALVEELDMNHQRMKSNVNVMRFLTGEGRLLTQRTEWLFQCVNEMQTAIAPDSEVIALLRRMDRIMNAAGNLCLRCGRGRIHEMLTSREIWSELQSVHAHLDQFKEALALYFTLSEEPEHIWVLRSWADEESRNELARLEQELPVNPDDFAASIKQHTKDRKFTYKELIDFKLEVNEEIKESIKHDNGRNFSKQYLRLIGELFLERDALYTSITERLSFNELPPQYICPLSQEIMEDPVIVVETGNCFERRAIQKWFADGNETDPSSKVKLTSTLVAPNNSLKDLIAGYHEDQVLLIRKLSLGESSDDEDDDDVDEDEADKAAAICLLEKVLSSCVYSLGNKEVCSQPLQELIQLADEDNVQAQWRLGMCYMLGLGTEVDECQAVCWFTAAADLGSREATVFLGRCHALGLGDCHLDEKQAFVKYTEASSEGFSDALWMLALCHENGMGTGKDCARALECMQEAAELGHEEALAACLARRASFSEAFSYEWRIGSVSGLSDNAFSKPFSAHGMEWRLNARLRGNGRGSSHLAIFLDYYRAESMPADFSLQCHLTLTLVNQKHKDLSREVEVYNRFSEEATSLGEPFHTPYVEALSDKSGFKVKDTIVIVAQIRVEQKE